MRYFSRVFELKINQQVAIKKNLGRQFRVIFKVIVDFGGQISYLDLSIYNLSSETAISLFNKGNLIEFSAGYEDGFGTIFVGRVSNFFTVREDTDVVSRVFAVSGSKDNLPILNKSLSSGATVVQLLKEISNSMGYRLQIDETQFKFEPKYTRGKVLYGRPLTLLKQLSKTHDFDFVIDLDQLIVSKTGAVRKSTPIIISELTGMQEAPEFNETGVVVTTCLDPFIRVFDKIAVASKLRTFAFNNMFFQDVPPTTGQGTYSVFKLEHFGDNYSESWATRITGFSEGLKGSL